MASKSQGFKNVSIKVEQYDRMLKLGEILLKGTGQPVNMPNTLLAMTERVEAAIKENSDGAA